MRILSIQSGSVTPLEALPTEPLEKGYVWIACERHDFEHHLPAIQACLQATCGVSLLDLHISDLRNLQLPSHYDYTSQYDLLVFRRLASGRGCWGGAVPATAWRRCRRRFPSASRTRSSASTSCTTRWRT